MNAKHCTTLLAAVAALLMWGCEDRGATSNAPDSVQTQTDAAQSHTEAAREHLDAAEDRIEERADQAESESGVIVQNARPLLDTALADIKAGRYDQAEQALDQLDDMDLPTSFDQQVADARELLEAERQVKPQEQGADANTDALGY